MDLYGIKQLVTCPICEYFLDSPIIIPCFNVICESHVINSQSDNIYNCPLCSDSHKIPKDGFKKNEKIEMVLRMQEHLNEQEKKLNEEMMKLVSNLEKSSTNLKEIKSKYVKNFLFIIVNS